MEKVNQMIYWATGILIGGISALLISQVFFRYVINESLSWSEEAARYLTIWAVFLGVAVALRRKSLIAVEVVVQFIPKRLEFIFRSIVLIASMLLMLFLIFKGIQICIDVSDEASTASGIPMWIPYASIPVGSFFTLLNIFVVLIEMFAGKEGQKT